MALTAVHVCHVDEQRAWRCFSGYEHSSMGYATALLWSNSYAEILLFQLVRRRWGLWQVFRSQDRGDSALINGTSALKQA